VSNPFTDARPSIRRFALAAYIVTATITFACGSRGAIAADMPLKAPEVPPYQWSGCYVGANLGGGASGTNFGSTVGPGTHLLGADPALVGGSGGGGANGDGLLAGGLSVATCSPVFGCSGWKVISTIFAAIPTSPTTPIR
jgi:hypothetical protein